MSGAGDPSRALHIFLIAGEKSGDELGARLIPALRQEAGGDVRFSGVGGDAMQGQGLKSLFPLTEIAVMGFLPVLARLPSLLRRIRQTADAVNAARPDVFVIIDSPDFTHRVARRVRARLPDMPIVDYVSPTVWAWRPGRAKKMRAYVDHVLALLPFEPAAHQRLGGPQCTYVGHPLIERLTDLRASAPEVRARDGKPPLVVVLPGSRRSEIARLMDVFGETVARVAKTVGDVEFVLPAVAHVEDEIRARCANWPVKPRIVTGEAEKFAAFRRARAALAASGTVTLELGLAQIPMVVGYRVPKLEEHIVRMMTQLRSFVLPNLILDATPIPGFLQEECNAVNLTAALAPLLRDGPERAAQMAALERLDQLMRLPDGESPSTRAARLILAAAHRQTAP